MVRLLGCLERDEEAGWDEEEEWVEGGVVEEEEEAGGMEVEEGVEAEGGDCGICAICACWALCASTFAFISASFSCACANAARLCSSCARRSCTSRASLSTVSFATLQVAQRDSHLAAFKFSSDAFFHSPLVASIFSFSSPFSLSPSSSSFFSSAFFSLMRFLHTS